MSNLFLNGVGLNRRTFTLSQKPDLNNVVTEYLGERGYYFLCRFSIPDGKWVVGGSNQVVTMQDCSFLFAVPVQRGMSGSRIKLKMIIRCNLLAESWNLYNCPGQKQISFLPSCFSLLCSRKGRKRSSPGRRCFCSLLSEAAPHTSLSFSKVCAFILLSIFICV